MGTDCALQSNVGNLMAVDPEIWSFEPNLNQWPMDTHDTKLFINDLLHRLLNLLRAKQDRADVRGVFDEAKEIIFSLQNLGEVTWNALIVHIIWSKLPSATLAVWEQHCGNPTVIANFQVLDDFLENRIRTLHAIESKSQAH